MLEDLLRLVALFLPSTEKTVLPASVYILKRTFVDVFPHVPGRKVSYYSTCQALLDDHSSCEKGSCLGDVKEFVSISLSQQLKLKLEGMCVCTCT